MVFVPLTELRSVRASSLTRALLSWVSSSVPYLPVSLQPSSPGAQAHLRTAGANRPSRSVPVVSHHLNGLLRLQLRGLVASRYQHKVRRFSSIPARQLPNRSGQSVGAPRTPFQATLLTPFRVFPSPVAAPRHPPRAACFRAETPKCFNPSASRLGGSPTAVALMTFPPVRLAAFHNPVARTASNRDLPESVAFKALLHCRVRCDAPSLLIALRSLLPWA